MLWSVAAVLRPLVAIRSKPPRSIELGPLARAAYGAPDARLLEILGAFLVAPALLALTPLIPRGDGSVVVVAAALVALGLAILFVPAWVAVRGRRAATLGLVATARVTGFRAAPGIGTRGTIAGMTNGFRVGTMLVESLAGPFESPFQYDGPQASALRVGSIFHVLVAADRQRVLFNLGLSAPLAATDSSREMRRE